MATNVWLDCDPGHDDAIAILLALHLPQINLLGVSTVHGNAPLQATHVNACRLIASFGSKEQARTIPVFAGAEKPLMRQSRHDAEIHGEDGLSGVEGLLGADHDAVVELIQKYRGQNAILAIRDCANALPAGQALTVVATGALTNIALLVSMFPELIRDGRIDRIVLMGGAEGRGNRSPCAEFNILIDPEAASIVFQAPLPVVMIPLNVTHTAIFTSDHDMALIKATQESLHQSGAATNLRHTLTTLLGFFASTYRRVFGFDGPPVHDPLTVAYLARPDLFEGRRYNVQVETSSPLTLGTTVVDLWNYLRIDPPADDRSGWGEDGLNVLVIEKADVDGFWQLFLETVDNADEACRLNIERIPVS